MHLIRPEIENEGVFEVIVKVLECVRSDLVRGRGVNGWRGKAKGWTEERGGKGDG